MASSVGPAIPCKLALPRRGLRFIRARMAAPAECGTTPFRWGSTGCWKAMATDPSFIEYVKEQSGLDERITCKRMFGEYGIYIDGKIVAFACDNSLFVKAAPATAALTASLPLRPPYPGAKGYPVADELLDDSEQLQALLVATAAAMPEPKARKPGNRR